MGCRVKYNQENNVIEVYAENGNVSNLWRDLSNHLGDPNKAYEQYVLSRTPMLQTSFSGLRDENNEPLASEVSTILDNFSVTDPQPISTVDSEANQKLNSQIKIFLEEMGVPYRAVTNLTDKNGNPIKELLKLIC